MIRPSEAYMTDFSDSCGWSSWVGSESKNSTVPLETWSVAPTAGISNPEAVTPATIEVATNAASRARTRAPSSKGFRMGRQVTSRMYVASLRRLLSGVEESWRRDLQACGRACFAGRRAAARTPNLDTLYVLTYRE